MSGKKEVELSAVGVFARYSISRVAKTQRDACGFQINLGMQRRLRVDFAPFIKQSMAVCTGTHGTRNVWMLCRMEWKGFMRCPLSCPLLFTCMVAGGNLYFFLMVPVHTK
jgi:hypothetical protein